MKTDLQKLLALALDGDETSQKKLTALIVRSDRTIWKSIVESAAVSALEAAELAKMPPAISDSHCLGLVPFVRLVRSQKISNSIAKRICNFVHNLH